MSLGLLRRSGCLPLVLLAIAASLALYVFHSGSRLALPSVPARLPVWPPPAWRSDPAQPSLRLRPAADGHLYFLDQPVSGPFPAERHPVAAVEHPITTLIHNASALWHAKLRRQSPDLRSAAAEYFRRHNRRPPRGFDQWWKWASDHKVQLLDEYDSMYHAFEPFFALPTHVFRQRVDDLLNNRTKWKADLFFLSVNSANLALSGPQAPNGGRPKELLNLMADVAHLLPDVQLPISSMDLPVIAVSAKNHEHHVQLARQSRFLPDSELLETFDEPGLKGWANTCPATSRFRRELNTLDWSAEPASQSYIVDHPPAMNMCDHPDLSHQIGFLAFMPPKVHPFFPLLSFSKPHGFAEIPITPTSQYAQPTGPDPAWANKTKSRMIWRGSTTGIIFSKKTNWRQSQRMRLVQLANEPRGNVTVRLVDPATRGLSYFQADTTDLNSKYFDVGFTGQPVQCDVEDGTCEEMGKSYAFKEMVEGEEINKHKYIMDVDGNGWSGRFHRMIQTKSVLLKSTVFPEWYADRIQPWYHYVPVRVDYQDLHDIMAFFLGDLEGRGAQDDEAEKIGQAGSEWAHTFWRREDMQAYMYRLILEYARLLKRGEEDMDYHYQQ